MRELQSDLESVKYDLEKERENLIELSDKLDAKEVATEKLQARSFKRGVSDGHPLLKSRPYEKFLADFCTSALLKALKINLLYSKMFKFSEVLKCKSLLGNFHMVST